METPLRYHLKVIRITAEDSPNVKLALMQKARGVEPTREEIVPGVLGYDEYCKRLKLWDEVRKTIGLWARFYVGAELLLFPPNWLDRANYLSTMRKSVNQYGAKVWMGIDPAEGGDKSAWALIDELGLFKLESKKTPRTTDIVDITVDLIVNHGIPPENVCMDTGGGGKQHADRIRQLGYNIRTVGFAESTVPEIRKTRTSRPYTEKVEAVEEKYVYFNRRAQLYGELSIAMDPTENGAALGLDYQNTKPENTYPGFAIPSGGVYDELRRQLAPIPKTWDKGGEGRLKLLPKNNSEDPDDPRTLVALIGHSPDEADALVLALHARLHKAKPVRIGGWY